MTTVDATVTVVLSPRQHEMLLLKLRGYTDHEIAARLCVSPNTVGITINRAYERIRWADVLRADLPPHLLLQQLTVAVMSGRIRFAVSKHSGRAY